MIKADAKTKTVWRPYSVRKPVEQKPQKASAQMTDREKKALEEYLLAELRSLGKSPLSDWLGTVAMDKQKR
ncbi:MAG: hypothetical protein H8D34_18925 [Chloroflexi bacterium]|nr:hypothetical protein [Chloroflexota bacterium]